MWFCKGAGEEKTGSLGLADAIICRMDKQVTYV